MKTIMLALTVAVLACGGEATAPPAYEEFTPVSAEWDVELYGDDVVAVGLVTFRDAAGHLVEGARVRVHASVGIAGASATDATGTADVTWTFVKDGGGGVAELTACASNHAARCDTYHTILVINQ